MTDMVMPLGSCDKNGDLDLFSRIKEFVQSKQEERGKEYPVSLEEIAREFGKSEEWILTYLAVRADDATFNGMDLFVRFNG